jgi:hypothetical protein
MPALYTCDVCGKELENSDCYDFQIRKEYMLLVHKTLWLCADDFRKLENHMFSIVEESKE